MTIVDDTGTDLIGSLKRIHEGYKLNTNCVVVFAANTEKTLEHTGFHFKPSGFCDINPLMNLPRDERKRRDDKCCANK